MSDNSLPQDHTHVTYDMPGQPGVLYLARSPLPLIDGEQILIKVHAAGVNGPDLAQRKGVYPAPQGASPILGLEVAGEVVAIGSEVNQWQIGNRVCALVPGGGYGEYVMTDAKHCLPMPKGWRYQDAAAIVETFFTVWGNLFMRAGLKAGETVLIHGGSGGVGSAAIVLAKAFGARVLVTSGSDEKCDYCLSLGADIAINYHQDFVKPVMEYTQSLGVEVVFDVAGGDFINQNLKVLAIDGRMVSVAMQRGSAADVDIFRIMAKRLTWTGSTLRPQSAAAKAEIAAELLEKVWPLLVSSSTDKYQLKPHIFAEFLLADCVKAHELMESGRHRGKLVFTLLT